MSAPYVGEIRIFAGNFAPNGWFFCDGAILAIDQYSTLFNLIGTTYGGDGQNTFALPDLRSRIPVHQGNSYVMGEMAGVENVTLNAGNMAAHSHPLPVSAGAATAMSPAGNVIAPWSGDQYLVGSPTGTLAATSVGASGSDLPHDNMPPYLALNFIISLFGIFPSQN